MRLAIGLICVVVAFAQDAGNLKPPDISTPTLPPAPLGAYPTGPVVLPPVPTIDNPPPEFTEEARLAELEGTVWVSTVVGADGAPRGMQTTRGLGLGLDEKAVEAIRGWRFWPGIHDGKNVDTHITVPVDFVLPSKQSRWHLVEVSFRPPEGVSRPVFRSVIYPSGAGVSRQSIDEGRVIVAIGRQATATLLFDVNQDGRPVGFKLESASDERWGPEAIAVVQNWVFSPGMKEGKAVSVPCALTLVWGRRSLDTRALRNISQRPR